MIRGPLNFEVAGPVGAPTMVFLHPTPLDSACWMYQVAHLSNWFRCVAIDLPGFGRSPKADSGTTMADVAVACWDAVDRSGARGEAIVMGCSLGSIAAQHMYHVRPELTRAVILTGAGWWEDRSFFDGRIANYRSKGFAFRYDHTLELFAPDFAASPMGVWFAEMFVGRSDHADIETIVAMFQALMAPDPDGLQEDLDVPVLILTGDHDIGHESAFVLRDRLPNAELVVLDGTGHAAMMEQPWRFDAEVLAFLERIGAHPGPAPAP